MTLKQLKTPFILAAITLFAAAIGYFSVHELSFLKLAERSVSDIFAAYMLPNEPQDADIVIVGIDEDTLAQFPYRSPVDREFLAGLLTTLEKANVRAIAMDVLFDQPTEPEKDALLKKTIDGLTVPLAISYSDDPDQVTEEQLQYLNDYVPQKMRVWDNEPEDPVDGEVREIPAGKTTKDGYLPGFARGTAALVGIQTPAIWQEIAWHGHDVNEADEPPFYTANARLLPVLVSVSPDKFANKIALIGGIFSITDRHRTPLAAAKGGNEGNLPGIVIHAHAVSQLIHGRVARHLSGTREWAFLLLLSMLGTLFGKINHSLMRHAIMAALTVGALFGCVFYCYKLLGVSVPIVEPAIAFFLSIAGTDAFTGREERHQRQFINGAFARYLNPSLVKQLADDPSKLQLGGEMREMTLMFCDIRGFTTISEQFDAQGLTRFINRFLTPMTDLIMASGGTIDKYMGDCIMAFWNAPLEDAGHAEHGCRAALGMRAKLKELNALWKSEAEGEGRKHIPVNIGIGLNSDMCCVGNVGSDQRFDYSVLGDGVNLASRLEGQSKTYHLDIVIGERTAAAATNMAILELDAIMVKGKTKPVYIFSLLGEETVKADPAFITLKESHDAMIAAYRAQDWAGARSHLAACHEKTMPLMEGLYELYDERVADYEANPPPADWDGVYVALSK